ncbi:hypothetical protein ACFQPF_14755 [Fictibacillus iocasae]|uniref:Holin n=1 Tax=Fictibacillus iocasae TaxID=2715437 RepID=A0ABW2NU72_9BACL
MFEKIVIVGFVFWLLFDDYRKSKNDTKSKKMHLCLSGITLYLSFLFFSEKSLINLDDLFVKVFGPAAQFIITSLQT